MYYNISMSSGPNILIKTAEMPEIELMTSWLVVKHANTSNDTFRVKMFFSHFELVRL